jgi:hypothetical protein
VELRSPLITRVSAPLAALALLLSAAAPAGADDLHVPQSLTSPPPGHRLTAMQVIAVAKRQPKVRGEERKRGELDPVAYTNGPYRWQVSFFQRRAERAQVIVADPSGRALESWVGPQVAWKMARGYPGAFASSLDAVYVWIPLCLVFIVPFVDVRRPFRLLHLDLLMLLGFSVSLAFFNHARIDVSVPLAYPFLLYLLARLLVAGFRRGPPRGRLIPHVPLEWLAVGLVALVAFRIVLNVFDSGVIDVGYGGVIGAHRIATGHGLYTAGWPKDIDHGDTYGPLTYLAYVPFERLLGWSGRWDDLPAAHATALAFDLLTMIGLFALGRRLRPGRAGLELGTALSFAWAAYPFTLFALDTNTNDSLVALLVVGAMLLATSPLGRGAAVGLGAAAKFVPLALLPLFTTAADSPRRWRNALLTAAAAAAVIAVSFAPFIPHGGVDTVWRHTVGYQAGRQSPFSIWGEHPSLGWLLTTVKALTAALALVVAVLPRRRTLPQCAALAAAVLIAVQLCAHHWFYLYIVWFAPLALYALFAEQETEARAHARPPKLVEPVTV